MAAYTPLVLLAVINPMNYNLKIAMLSVAAVAVCSFASAQYYYQDVVAKAQTEEQYRLMKENRIQRMEAKSLDADGEPTRNFVLFQKLDARSGELATYSKSDFTGTSVLTTRFNPQGQVTLSMDSSSSVVTRTEYSYDAAGRLSSMNSRSYDANQTFTLTEVHRFSYDAQGRPIALERIKGGNDTTNVVFVPAENGLPGEEHWFKNGRKIETWYYYYNDAKQLTDVVRYNLRAQRMIPDYVFEYQEDGKMSGKTVVNTGTGQYRVWRVEYLPNGLKQSEMVQNKYKQREGTVTYSYQ